MANIETLSIQVAAQTRDAQDDLEELRDDAVQLSVAFQSTAGGAARAEDEIEEAGDAAARSSAQFSGATVSLFGLSASATTVAAALFTLSAALAAVATAAVGLLGIVAALGGAFGLLAVAGIIGNMRALKQTFSQVVPEIRAALAPLAEVLGPLLIQAVEALPALAENIVAAVGGTEEFAETAELFGETMFRIIPLIVGAMFDLARAVLPAVNAALRGLEENGRNAFGFINAIMSDLLPHLRALGVAIAMFLPEFIKFGATVSEVLLPAISGTLAVLTPLLAIFNALPDPVKQVTIALIGMQTVLGMNVPLAAGLATAALQAVGVSVYAALGPFGLLMGAAVALAAAFHVNFLGIRDIVEAVMGEVVGWLDWAIDKIYAFVGAIGDAADAIANTPGIKQALDIGGGIAQVVGGGGGGGGGTNVQVGQINANSRSGGRDAARGLRSELSGNTLDTSRSE